MTENSEQSPATATSNLRDIVQRLREAHPHSPQYLHGSMILAEAADEIERLRRDVRDTTEQFGVLKARYDELRQERDRLSELVEDIRCQVGDGFRAEIARLRAALERVTAEACGVGYASSLDFHRLGILSIREIASEALSAEPPSEVETTQRRDLVEVCERIRGTLEHRGDGPQVQVIDAFHSAVFWSALADLYHLGSAPKASETTSEPCPTCKCVKR